MHSPLIQALLDPSRYPHPVDSVSLLETHISWVLLAGEYAYKIKKPVNFGFLDFSDLQLRGHFCMEEVRLNRRTAPDLYLDVVDLTGTEERPEFGGAGPVIEYAVRMQRFDPEQGFDRLLARHELSREHVEDLGVALADLHEAAAVAPADAKWGSSDEVIGPMRDNFTDLKKYLGDDGRQSLLDRLNSWTEERFARLKNLISERRQQGFVRECHGDVHLGNVTLVDGRATLFDCIEFSPDLRWTDVMADLAFMVMDLHEHDAGSYAWVLIDRYLAQTGDYEGLALLDFYVVYRAMVRAKVAALGLGEDPDANQHILAIVDRYLACADRVIVARQPLLLLTCGVSGSGKSYLARSLLANCGLIRLRSDVERKRLAGLGEYGRSESGLGDGLYGLSSTQKTYQRLLSLAEAVTNAGLPVLVDATFLNRQQRDAFRELAKTRDIPFGVLHCSAPEPVLRDRVSRRAINGNDPSEADLAVLESQLQNAELPVLDDPGTFHIDTSLPDSLAEAERWLESLMDRPGV